MKQSNFAGALAALLLTAACGGENESSTSHKSIEGLPPPSGAADHALAGIIADFMALNVILSRVTSEETAKAEVPELRQAVTHLYQTLQQAQAISDADKASANAEYRQRLDQETMLFSQHFGRLMQIPGAAPPVMEVLEAMPGLGPPPVSNADSTQDVGSAAHGATPGGGDFDPEGESTQGQDP